VVLQFITEEEDDVVVMDNHWAGFIRALGEIQETKGWGGGVVVEAQFRNDILCPG
jgi:hypothetical protein